MSTTLGLGTVTRLVVAGALGATVALGAGAMTAAPPPTNLLLPPGTDYDLTADTGDVRAQFTLTGVAAGTNPAGPGASAAPVELQALPDTAQLTLVAYKDGPAPDTAGPNVRPSWLAPVGFPRVKPLSQFDGGPLGNANCTMTSGAMLARLGFGIVATGSQLRALQPDQVGGTSLADLEVAIEKFGVRFNRAPLSALQLRALMYAGAGAVIQGTYGIIPFELRLQKNFLGGHAIYLDGFRPASAAGPAAYYVLDPLGPVWSGYKGAWWPADIIEAFAENFGGGSIYTSWAFPGGATPRSYPKLPPDAFPTGHRPGDTPEPTPRPGETTPPPVVPTPPELPTPDPSATIPPAGDSPPPTPSDFNPGGTGVLLDPGVISVLLGVCAGASPPSWCPIGIIGVLPPDPVAIPTLPPLAVPPTIDLLYANAIGPGTMQVIFTVPDGSLPSLQFWGTQAGAGALSFASSIEPALLDGRPVQVAQFQIQPGTSYNFVASAAGAGVRAISQVGTVGQ